MEEEVIVLDDGEGAVDFFERIETDPAMPCPDLLLLDLNLTKVNGGEILEIVRNTARCRELPVIVITSSHQPGDREMANRFGALEFIQKPSDLEAYMNIGLTIKDVLKKSPPHAKRKTGEECGMKG